MPKNKKGKYIETYRQAFLEQVVGEAVRVSQSRTIAVHGL